MEKWRDVWRNAVRWCLSRSAMWRLLGALEEDSVQLIRGATTRGERMGDGRILCVACCPLAYAEKFDRELEWVPEVEAAFAELLAWVALFAGSKLAITPLLDWIDTAPWNVVRQELMEELHLVLRQP